MAPSGLQGPTHGPALLVVKAGRRTLVLSTVAGRPVKITKAPCTPLVVSLLIYRAPKSRSAKRFTLVSEREGPANDVCCSALGRPRGGIAALLAVFISHVHTVAMHGDVRPVCHNQADGQTCRSPSSRRLGRYCICYNFPVGRRFAVRAIAIVGEG